MDLRSFKVLASKCPRCGCRYPRADYTMCPSCADCDFEYVDLIEDGEMELRFEPTEMQIQPGDYTPNPGGKDV